MQTNLRRVATSAIHLHIHVSILFYAFHPLPFYFLLSCLFSSFFLHKLHCFRQAATLQTVRKKRYALVTSYGLNGGWSQTCFHVFCVLCYLNAHTADAICCPRQTLQHAQAEQLQGLNELCGGINRNVYRVRAKWRKTETVRAEDGVSAYT